jgi:hypothetical protein
MPNTRQAFISRTRSEVLKTAAVLTWQNSKLGAKRSCTIRVAGKPTSDGDIDERRGPLLHHPHSVF